jgi:hypothetical protein
VIFNRPEIVAIIHKNRSVENANGFVLERVRGFGADGRRRWGIRRDSLLPPGFGLRLQELV